MKKNQQPKLYIENIDGTIIPEEAWDNEGLDRLSNNKKLGMYLTYHLLNVYSYCATLLPPNNNKGIVTNINQNKISEYCVKNAIPLVAQDTLRACILTDDYSRNAGQAFKLYKESKNKKNYVMSAPLTKYMGKIQLDIPVSVLPDNFIGYIEPKGLIDETDNSKVLGVIVAIGMFSGYKMILVAMITESGCISSDSFQAFRTFIGDINDAETIDQMQEAYDTSGTGDYSINDTRKPSMSLCLRTILNTVLYINGPNESFIEQFNSFSRKEKIKKVQIKSLSQKGFIKIGYKDASFLKLLVEKEVSVKWHYRNQPYGPGRKYRKMIVISPHIRKIKNYFDKEG